MVQLGEKDQGCKMITGLKKEYPKASKSVLQKAQYEQKNSSVNLKNLLGSKKEFLDIYKTFKSKLEKLRKKKIVVAVSGGSDSLALTVLAKIYGFEKNIKIFYVLIDHNIRKNSSNEANTVKKLLKKFNESLTIIKNKKLLIKTFKVLLERFVMTFYLHFVIKKI